MILLLRGLLQRLELDERRLDLLTKGVEEKGADEDEGEAEADEEGDDASDEERGASVLLQKQVKVANLDDTGGCSATLVRGEKWMSLYHTSATPPTINITLTWPSM